MEFRSSSSDQSNLGFPPVHVDQSVEELWKSPPMMGLSGWRAGVAVDVMALKVSGETASSCALFSFSGKTVSSCALLSSSRLASVTTKNEDAEETWLVGDESSSPLSVGRLGSPGALQ